MIVALPLGEDSGGYYVVREAAITALFVDTDESVG